MATDLHGVRVDLTTDLRPPAKIQSTPATSRSLGLGFGDSLVGATTRL